MRVRSAVLAAGRHSAADSALESLKFLSILPAIMFDSSAVFQKAIIEQFLPRYGFGAEVLYVGDAAKKFLVRDEQKLKSLKFFELEHGELPDIVAYSSQK